LKIVSQFGSPLAACWPHLSKQGACESEAEAAAPAAHSHLILAKSFPMCPASWKMMQQQQPAAAAAAEIIQFSSC